MKYIYRGIIFVFVITVVVSSVICFQLIQAKGEDVKSFPKNDIAAVQTVQIELKKPITLDALFSAGNSFSFEGMILESEFIFNNEAIYDFYLVNSKSEKKNIKDDYIKNRKAFLIDTKKAEQLSAANFKSVENILITKITMTGKSSDIDEIKKGLEISKINIKPAQFAIASQVSGKSMPKEAHLLGNGTMSTAALTTTPMYLSLPTSGTSYFYPSSSGGRYTQQNMKWSAINFASDQTYEHKVILYNYDRKTYLDGNSTAYPGCYPTTTYAATSWPAASKPYIDTRFMEPKDGIGCEINELSYTIGAAQADALQANINYYTYIRTADGNDTTDKFKIQGQVGYRNPSYCYTTWCSAKYKIYFIIPFSLGTTVPGTQSWIYNGQAPDAPSNVSITNPTATSLRVNFTDNTYDETNILIERKIGINGSYVSLGGFGAITGIGSWYWINTGLSSKTTYCYRLKAMNSIGSSAYSNEACGTTL